MSRVVHFEIPVDEPERAVDFYTQVFDWKVQKWEGPEPYWLVNTGEEGPGIGGALMRRQEPVTSTVNTIGVSSVDEYCEKITAHGGKVVMPKMAIAGVGYFAYCADTENNLFGIIQEDCEAK